MFSQQKQPAFKFVIKSKITDSTPPPLDDPSAEVPPLPVLSPKQEPLPSSTLPSSSSASSSSPPPPPPHTKQDKPASPPPAEMGDRKRKRTDKEPTTLATKKVHGQLQKWNQKSAELKTAVAAEDEEEALKSSDLEEDEFADLDLMACLLCQRKFKSRQDLQRHQDLSELHKKNLADPACIDKARMKKRFARTDAEKQSDQAAEQNYRNRAAERRQAYGQPEKPALPREPWYPKTGKPKPKIFAERPAAVTSVNKALSDDNKGAQMLKQMGWKQGAGLGKDGTGIVNPIAAEQYAQGAGLGSAHAKYSSSTTSALAASDSYRDRVKEMASNQGRMGCVWGFMTKRRQDFAT